MEKKRFYRSSFDQIIAAVHLDKTVEMGVYMGENSKPVIRLSKDGDGKQPFAVENLKVHKRHLVGDKSGLVHHIHYCNYEDFREWLHTQLEFEYPLYWESK